MSKIRYGVAMSLDGYIAGPNGEADWIVIDPAFDFAKLWAEFDILLMGRRTYQAAILRLGAAVFQETRTVVVSRTLEPADHPGITILPEVNPHSVQSLRDQSRKDIWLMGGGELFRFLLTMGEVDTVEVSLIPVLLGMGVPLLPPSPQRSLLHMASHKAYPSGSISLVYDVRHNLPSS